ncbi:MAG: hypothetical protein LBG77_01295 [Dysgonamonadaceae bacterium]|nr:hypothetical protein [Dysgonamonadaceae bacterium]
MMRLPCATIYAKWVAFDGYQSFFCAGESSGQCGGKRFLWSRGKVILI